MEQVVDAMSTIRAVHSAIVGLGCFLDGSAEVSEEAVMMLISFSPAAMAAFALRPGFRHNNRCVKRCSCGFDQTPSQTKLQLVDR